MPIIQGVDYSYHDNANRYPALWQSFNQLAQATFGLNFGPWRRLAGDDGLYLPHCLARDGQVVCNVSVTLVRLHIDGDERLCIQLGTVMTHSGYRGRGLAAWLLERVLARWARHAHCVYLYANDRVLGFYPRFAFLPAGETVWRQTLQPLSKRPAIRRLDVQNKTDRALVLAHYEKGNPLARISDGQSPGLVLFHALQAEAANRLYHIPAWRVVAVASHQPERICLGGVYGSGTHTAASVCAALPGRPVQAEYGFTPADAADMQAGPLVEADSTLFLLGGKPPCTGPFRFPALSHA